MKRLLLLLSLVVFGIIVACGFSFLTNKANYTTWVVQGKTDSSGIVWSPFYWGSDSMGGRYIERSAMHIPVKIDGFPSVYRFQFDLGANSTEIYEKNLQSLFTKWPELKSKIGRLKSPLQFWNSRLSVNDVTFHMGNITATNKHCYLHRSYGDSLPLTNLSDSSLLQLGTIGADIFQNRVLIIDYPGQRFAVCDVVPPSYKTNFVDIELDEGGRVILPMRINGKTFRVTFDNGSSLFPLITQAKNMSQFTSGVDSDTLEISSWGKLHRVTGKLITDTVELAGRKYSGVKIYANHAGYGTDKNTDATAGNALFWNNTIIIDFKNKKFGVR